MVIDFNFRVGTPTKLTTEDAHTTCFKVKPLQCRQQIYFYPAMTWRNNTSQRQEGVSPSPMDLLYFHFEINKMSNNAWIGKIWTHYSFQKVLVGYLQN